MNKSNKSKFNKGKFQAETSTNDFLENESEILEYDNFCDMGLKETILRGVYAYGFESPSKIQSRALMPVISGTDVIAQSQSGTGKTGTFVISALERVDENVSGVQVVIVSHTMELAAQISEVCKNIGKYTKTRVISCIRGKNSKELKKYSQKEPIIVVGTPGKIIHMIELKELDLKNLKLLILDEADILLSDNFQEQSKEIVQSIPELAQICLFSATFPREVIDLTNKFLKNPKKILLKQEKISLDGIKQFYLDVKEEHWKFETLCDIYNQISINQSMIYVNSKKRAMWLSDKLIKEKFTVSVIHGELETSERDSIMNNFREGLTRVLISTDLLSRGIDVQQVSFVINYDLPDNKECYIHRIGRSGRFGRRGVAINFSTQNDNWKLGELEKYYGTMIEQMPVNIEDYL